MEKDTWSGIVYWIKVILETAHQLGIGMGDGDPVEEIEELAAMAYKAADRLSEEIGQAVVHYAKERG